MPVTLFTCFQHPTTSNFDFQLFQPREFLFFALLFFAFTFNDSSLSSLSSSFSSSSLSSLSSSQSPFGSSLVEAWSQKSQVGVVRISCTSASSVRVLRVPHTFCKRELDLRFVFVSRLVPALMVVVQHQTEPIDCPWMTVPDKHWHDTLVAVRGSCRLDTNPLRQYLAPRHTSPNAQQHQNDQPP